ncbi:MAG: hypothetical protein L0Y66_09295 [Myxococcaceae bacterium]|nr:hypothetical protein [Myxococcaceae bacterium]
MPKAAASATKVVLALLGASRGKGFSAPSLIEAGTILGVSSNAVRVALSRLSGSGDVVPERRGHYTLADERMRAYAHVRAFRTGFAARVPWKGEFLGVLTSDLSRKNAAAVRRRERALELVGMRAHRHGLFVRPDNLEGARTVVATHLARLGLDAEADVVGLRLDAAQSRAIETLYDVGADRTRAVALEENVQKLLGRIDREPPRKVAAACFFLGDEVLRFLARDPLLPESMADPAPRKALTHAMSTLDDRGHELWTELLEEPRSRGGRT